MKVGILVLFQFQSLKYVITVYDICCRVLVGVTLRKTTSMWSFLRIFIINR